MSWILLHYTEDDEGGRGEDAQTVCYFWVLCLPAIVSSTCASVSTKKSQQNLSLSLSLSLVIYTCRSQEICTILLLKLYCQLLRSKPLQQDEGQTGLHDDCKGEHHHMVCVLQEGVLTLLFLLRTTASGEWSWYTSSLRHSTCPSAAAR